ncbi:hypothetical protein I4B38_004168 [Enterobacter hormaechei]|nr:hypothetical protein [Enterobacter hormaechei]EHN8897296.1 hypothetical protein [Enterobacter hormaechei]
MSVIKEDFDRIPGARQGKMRQFLSGSGGFSAKSTENHQLEKKDLKNTCAKNWDPYNAPPSTRRM